MKKWITGLLVLTTVFSLFGFSGCGEEEVDVYEEKLSYTKNANQAWVFEPMSETPCYKLEEGASVEEMRQMAVKAMYDEISFRWTPLESFSYKKTGAGENAIYYFGSDTVFAGMPYTSAGLSLFHMLDYYDPETGVLYGLNGGDANMLIGNNCAPSVNWGLAAVCQNIKASDTGSMTEKGGFVPVGGYDISDIERFTTGRASTPSVIERVGREKMYECLALVVTADALVTNPEGSHAMMAIEPAKVVRTADGKIDPKESTITIQDQRFGEKFMTAGGQTVSYRGRYDAVLTFEYLLDEGYIPLRAKELDDENHKYVVPTAKLSKECESIGDLQNAVVETNFRVCKIEAKLISDSGKTVLLRRANTAIGDYLSGEDRKMEVKRVLPTKAEVSEAMKSGHDYTLQISAFMADGEDLVVFSKEVNAGFFE